MNTVDIREMQVYQTMFWAVALPLTALVVACTLYVVEVPPLRRRWRGVPGREGF